MNDKARVTQMFAALSPFWISSFGFPSSFVIWSSVCVDMVRSNQVNLSTTEKKLRIALVRRGYSRTGGAESYLKRLGHGIVAAGHNVQLVATDEWPEDQWPFGSIKRLSARTVIGFADELEQI